MKIFILIFIITFHFSCRNLIKDQNPHISQTTHFINYKQANEFEIQFYTDGKVATMKNKINDNEIQILKFYPDGQIKSKERYDSLGTKIGRHYEFHEGSACMKSDFRYEDGLRYGSGRTTHSNCASKGQYLYDDHGKLRFKIRFNEEAEIIEEIGDPNFELENPFWKNR